MAKATGLGGTFLRARDPEALYKWYELHLGLSFKAGCFLFPAAEQRAYSVLAFFPENDTYWPSSQPAMLNLQVDDLDGLLDNLIAAGVPVNSDRQSFSYGGFGWFTDPEGNRVDLWEPSASGTHLAAHFTIEAWIGRTGRRTALRVAAVHSVGMAT